MEMRDEIVIFLAYGISIFTIFFCGKLLVVPIKLIKRIVVNSLIGAGMLAFLNIVGDTFSIAVPLNVLTAAVAGCLGIPGILMLVLLIN